MTKPHEHPPQIGVAIAGGGVSGAAAVGVLRALAEAGISVSHIAGSSSGAVVAAMYALGYEVEELRSFIPLLTKKQLDYDRQGILRRLLRRQRYLDGWIKGHRLNRSFEHFTKGAKLSDVPLPLGVVATDLSTGRPVVFAQPGITVAPGIEVVHDASLADALQASCAIPVLFQPVRKFGHILVDGGVVMNCPVSIVRQMGASFVLSVDTVTAFANSKVGQLPSALSIFAHVVNITLRNQMAAEHERADAAFHPDVGAVGALDFHKIEQCIEKGYEYAVKHIPAIFSKMGH